MVLSKKKTTNNLLDDYDGRQRLQNPFAGLMILESLPKNLLETRLEAAISTLGGGRFTQ